MRLDALRHAIIEVGRRLDQKGLVTATEGNISVRVEGGHLVTASGVSKGALTEDLVIFVDSEGRHPGAGPAVSSEDMMHAAIYRDRPDVQAVIHAHPPAATAFAVAHVPLDSNLLAESVILLGDVPLIPYAMPGSPALAEVVTKGLGSGHAALLSNHGAITVGRSLAQAHQRMETLEHVARVALMARLLGGARQLAPEDVAKLLVTPTGPYR